MKRIPCHIITAALAALVGLAPLTRAEHKNPYVGLYGQSLKAKTKKPDFFGKTKSNYQGRYGSRVGTSETTKPDFFGKTKTTFKNKSYQTVGTATTAKPDFFGRKKTEIKDKYGRVIGTAVTEKPDFFGNRKTTYKGHNPFNFFKKKDDKKK